jgi:hypothetical protein
LDDVLVTSPSNVAASLFWEGQLRNAVCEGSLRFLFDIKGTLYHGKGFEMLAALDQHCRPDLITNAFCMLMSLFNDVQGLSEAVFEFCSRFDGMVMDLSCSKIILPPILLVMLFLRALHSRYSDILDQFWSRYKKLEAATIDSVVENIRYHDEFKLVGFDKKTPGGSTPRASAANADKSGKEWASPFEWLFTYDMKRIKVRWDRAIAGTGICPICHCTEKPCHVPAKCPLLKDLNFKIVHGPPSSAPTPAPSASPAPAPAVPSPSPSPGGHVASTDDRSVAGSVGSPSAPSGLTASVAEDDFDSDPEFRWDGNDDGTDFDPPSCKSNNSVALYPSCSRVAMAFLPPSPSNTMTSSPVAGTSRYFVLPKNLHAIIDRMSRVSISPGPGRHLAVANLGATDHMFPNKEAFISYKSIQNLQVRMGNNSFLPVIGRGTAILSLNDQRVLVRNALNVPGLTVPLYSLRAHFKQQGCGFIGTSEAEILVYFPSFVLSVDTSSDCHLSYKPLGRSAPLDTLHYVQPRCSPNLLPLASMLMTLFTSQRIPLSNISSVVSYLSNAK